MGEGEEVFSSDHSRPAPADKDRHEVDWRRARQNLVEFVSVQAAPQVLIACCDCHIRHLHGNLALGRDILAWMDVSQC